MGLKTIYGNNITILKWKTCLVIEGFFQQAAVDYDDTYSFVLKTSSMWVFLVYMTNHNLDIHQMDVQTTFLNGELKEKIFMELPQRLQVLENSNFVCKLNKSLHGLKQSSCT